MKRDIPGYKKKLGALGEKIAGEYLQEVEGYRIITRNYTCSFGEIDIVAADKSTIVFVEVRSGSIPFAGFAEESIGFRKQKKLKQLASYYLKEKGLNGCLSRFDVVILLFERENLVVREIKLFKNAF
ncbi:MAG: YraN family protein [Dethiobacter sp.]|nr:MAG: YraN family protein [Dethiobacter sp.]